MTNQIEIKVPDIGDFSDIPVIEILVAVGESVEAEQSLLTLESDKAMMEVPAPVTGVIRELRVSRLAQFEQITIKTILKTRC